jgi:hypothetical protein
MDSLPPERLVDKSGFEMTDAADGRPAVLVFKVNGVRVFYVFILFNNEKFIC